MLKYREPTSPRHRTGISLYKLDSISHFGWILVRDSAKIYSWMKAGVDIWCEVNYKSDALWSERGGRKCWTGSVVW